MDKKTKQEYSTPKVEQISARVEKGFQTTGTHSAPMSSTGLEGPSNSGMDYNDDIFS